MKWNVSSVLALLVLLIFPLILAGCKEKMPTSLAPATCKITGNLGEYFEVVEGEYPVSEISSKLSFKVKRIKESEEGTIVKFGIGYAIFNDKGKALIAERAKLEDINPLMSLSFLGLKPGETGEVSIYIEGWPEKLKGAKTFRVAFDCELELPVSKLISLGDFIDYPHLSFNQKTLITRGFTESQNEVTGWPQYSKNEVIVEYVEDFDDDGEGTKGIHIYFPDMTDCYNFVSSLNDNDDWTIQSAPLGETYVSKKGNLMIYREISTLQITETSK